MDFIGVYDMDKLIPCLIFTLGVFSVNIAHSAMINITEDYTTALAQVTYEPNVRVVNPGTTSVSFAGAVFTDDTFTGYDLVGDRTAKIDFGNNEYDTTSYSARSIAEESAGFYEFFAGAWPGTYCCGNILGEAAAQTNMSLKFDVIGGDASIDLFAERESMFEVGLTLFDETLGVFIEEVILDSGVSGGGEFDVMLYESHSYVLTGYSYAHTPFSGDPANAFGFRFGGNTVISSVPEPSMLAFMLCIMANLGIRRYKFTTRW